MWNLRQKTFRRFTFVIMIIAAALLGKEGAMAASGAGTGLMDYGRKDYVRVSKDLPHAESGPWKLVCTMPYNCQFQPSIEVEAEAGKVIRFNSSNPLVQYLTKTETCTTCTGVQDYEAKNWISGKVLSIPCPPGSRCVP